MPTVPSEIVPQYSPQGGGEIGQFQAPPTAAAENLAAGQVARMGEAMTHAGDVAYRLASAEQDAIDQANAKAADTASMAAMQAPMDEYLATMNKDAVNGYAAIGPRLRALANEAMDSLGNDSQKAMLRPALERRIAIMESQARGHYLHQTRQWDTAESLKRSEMQVQSAIRMRTMRPTMEGPQQAVARLYQAEVERRSAVESARHALVLQGIPEGSDAMKAAVAGVEAQIATGVSLRLMQQHQYEDAFKYLDEADRAGTITEEVGRKLMDVAVKARDEYLVEQYTDSIRSFGKVSTKDEREADTSGESRLRANWMVTDAGTPLERQLDVADEIKDDGIREGVKARLRAMNTQDRAVKAANESQAYDEVEAMLLPRRDITLDVIPGKSLSEVMATPAWWRLTPEAQAHFLRPEDEARKRQEADEGSRVMAGYLEFPETLTATDLAKHKGMIPDTVYHTLEQRLAKEASDVRSVTVDATMVNNTLYENGLGRLVDTGSNKDDARESIAVRMEIERAIDVAQSAKKMVLSATEKQQVVDQVIIERYQNVAVHEAYTFGWDWVNATMTALFEGDETLAYSALTPEQRDMVYLPESGGRPDIWLRDIGTAGIKDISATWFAAQSREAQIAESEGRPYRRRHPSMNDLMAYWWDNLSTTNKALYKAGNYRGPAR